MRILVVEDDPGISRFVCQGLTEAGYSVECAADGKQGLASALASPCDVIILDVLLPGLDGLTVLKRLRGEGVRAPVLLLTALDTVQDRVLGLDAGADDYLPKPFHFSELLARVRALMRRPPLQADSRLQVGDLELDTVQRTVRRCGKLVELSPREYSLLDYLMRNPGQALSRTQIAQHVWSFDFYSDYKVIDVYIGYLRRKIDRHGPGSLIQTVRGVGYCIRAEDEPAAREGAAP